MELIEPESRDTGTGVILFGAMGSMTPLNGSSNPMGSDEDEELIEGNK